MSRSWYKNLMPKVKDVKSSITDLAQKIKAISGVKEVRAWGSYVKNLNNPSFPLRDLDLLVLADFHAADLLSIIAADCHDPTFNLSKQELEEDGLDPKAVVFTQKFCSIQDFNADHWCISNDDTLLHFGPITNDKIEWEDLQGKAEKYASQSIGIERDKLNKSSVSKRNDWYWNYKKFLDQYLEHMPGGWYESKHDVREILAETILIGD